MVTNWGVWIRHQRGEDDGRAKRGAWVGKPGTFFPILSLKLSLISFTHACLLFTIQDDVTVTGGGATTVNGHAHSATTSLSASTFSSPRPLLGRDVIDDVTVAMPTGGHHQA